MRLKSHVSKVLFGVSAILVFSGYYLQKTALESGNQLLINLSPDIMGSGLLVFVAGIVFLMLGNNKIR